MIKTRLIRQVHTFLHNIVNSVSGAIGSLTGVLSGVAGQLGCLFLAA